MINMEIAARDEAKHKGLMYNEYDRSKDVEGGGKRGPSRKMANLLSNLFQVSATLMKVIKCNNRYRMSRDFVLWELPTRGLRLFLGAALLVADKRLAQRLGEQRLEIS